MAQAIAIIDKSGESWWLPELRRLEGELLLKQDVQSVVEAERCFEQSIALAREQHSKSLELRATMSLARLLDRHRHRARARTLLANAYGWFTEGFDTADLKDAPGIAR